MPNMVCFYPFLSFTYIVKQSGKQEGKALKKNGCRERIFSIKQRTERFFRIRKRIRQ